jgi:hypothetical protein
MHLQIFRYTVLCKLIFLIFFKLQEAVTRYLKHASLSPIKFLLYSFAQQYCGALIFFNLELLMPVFRIVKRSVPDLNTEASELFAGSVSSIKKITYTNPDTI